MKWLIDGQPLDSKTALGTFWNAKWSCWPTFKHVNKSLSKKGRADDYKTCLMARIICNFHSTFSGCALQQSRVWQMQQMLLVVLTINLLPPSSFWDICFHCFCRAAALTALFWRGGVAAGLNACWPELQSFIALLSSVNPFQIIQIKILDYRSA